jgi:hypothetical protein
MLFRVKQVLSRWNWEDIVAVAACVSGLTLRLRLSVFTYLNPDEALHILPSLGSDWFQRVAVFHHPPLIFYWLHLTAGDGSSELQVRLAPILAGSLFPLVIYRWLRMLSNPAAALTALLILVFSPSLVALGAQVRGYPLALLFSACALLSIEYAWRRKSLVALGGSHLFLYLAILTEYSVAWLAGALACYFLVLAWQLRPPRNFVAAWAIGQAGAVLIYGWLALTHVAPLVQPEANERILTAYLTREFPHPGQNPIVFAVLGTLKQFAYVMGSNPGGAILAAFFAIGLVMMWLGRASVDKPHGRAFALCSLTGLTLACAAAMLRVYPYGRSRHTVILVLLTVPLASIAVSLLRTKRALFGLVLVLPILWPYVADRDWHNIPIERHSRQAMGAIVQDVHRLAATQAVLLTDRETALILSAYIPEMRVVRLETRHSWADIRLRNMKIVLRRWNFQDLDDFARDLQFIRARADLPRNTPVWVLDGGFTATLPEDLRAKSVTVDATDFGGAAQLFRAPDFVP